MEYLPRIDHIAALPQSPRVTVKIEHRARRFHWTDHLHVDVQRHLMGIQRTKKNASQMLNSSLYAKRFGAGQWSFLGPGSEKKWYSTHEYKPQRRIGQNCIANDVDICRKHTPNLPIHGSIVQRSAYEQRWWKIVGTQLRRPGND